MAHHDPQVYFIPLLALKTAAAKRLVKLINKKYKSWRVNNNLRLITLL